MTKQQLNWILLLASFSVVGAAGYSVLSCGSGSHESTEAAATIDVLAEKRARFLGTWRTTSAEGKRKCDNGVEGPLEQRTKQPDFTVKVGANSEELVFSSRCEIKFRLTEEGALALPGQTCESPSSSTPSWEVKNFTLATADDLTLRGAAEYSVQMQFQDGPSRCTVSATLVAERVGS